jgi:p-aminobenzoyl-glutamate transporter AbgT
MDALIPLALTIAPEIARWLFGTTADKTTAAITQAVQAVTGTVDPDAATAVLQRDPAAAAQLRLQLAQLAADQEGAARTADLATLAATLRDTPDARTQETTLASQRSAVVWSAPIVSGLVLLTFGSVMLLVLVYGIPAGTDTVANMLLGTLAAMATSVVSYWVGSSAGSARKEDRLAQLTRPTT